MESILVLGDSHALVFDSEAIRSLFPEFAFDTVSVGGATVSGLENPNAVTQAMPKYLAALEESQASTAIIMLGEVDTGFVIWYRAQKYTASVEDMYQQAIDNYKRFLIEASKRRHVICISTPLPTIRDGLDWGEVANLRKEVKATLKERTDLTIRFNKDIGSFCSENGISHCNFDSESVDEHGVLKDVLRNSDAGDHHYDFSAHAALISAKLRVALKSRSDQPPGPTIRSKLLIRLSRKAMSAFSSAITILNRK